MLPLTSSVYVNGTLASTESVLVDIGTGYYIEVRIAFSQSPGAWSELSFCGARLSADCPCSLLVTAG